MGVYKCINHDRGFENIETDHGCLAELYEDLSENGMVLCDRLITKRGENAKERIVTNRLGMIMTPASFALIEDATVRFIEEV